LAYAASPAWNQTRRNSGQAQTIHIHNHPVTSPYTLQPHAPFITDPVHTIQPNYGRSGVLSNPMQQGNAFRTRVLAWAHGVYANLVQVAQNSSHSSSGMMVGGTVSGRPPVRPVARSSSDGTLVY